MKYKKIIRYFICLLPWFISSIIFKVDTNYYKSLNLPFFAPPSILFPIVWTILYILIAASIYIISYKDIIDSNYKISLLVNYLSNQLYTLCFFVIKNNFLALCDALIVFISSLYLYLESGKYDDRSKKLLIPYIIWNLFATILSISIFILNKA